MTIRILPRFLRHPSPYLLLSLCALFWAGNWVVGRAMRDDIPPVAMGFWRWTLALLILLPFAFSELRREWRVVRDNWFPLMLLGALGAVAFNTMIYVGLQYTATTNAILFNSLIPIIIILLAWGFLQQRLTVAQALGVASSLAGAVWLVARGDLSTLAALQLNRGDLWILAAIVLWAVYTVILRWRPSGLSAIGFLAAMLLLSVPLLLPVYLWEMSVRGTFALTPSTILALAYFATIPSVVAYLFWNRGVAQVGPNKAGLFVHLMPVFGAALAVVFLGERLYAYHYTGAMLVFGGIWMTSKQG